MMRDRFPTLADFARNIAAQRRLRRQLFGISRLASEHHDETTVGFEKRGLPGILRKQGRQTVRFIVPLAIVSSKRALE
jgi:hypothetical protein